MGLLICRPLCQCRIPSWPTPCALQERVILTFMVLKGLVYVPILSYFALLQRILGTVSMPDCCYNPFCQSSITSHPIPYRLHYRRGYKGLLVCLNAATISSVNLGCGPHLTPHYCRRCLELLMCSNAATVPFVRLGCHLYLLLLHYHGASRGLLMCLNEAMVP